MTFSLSLITNWAVGIINGYKQKENGLPNGIKYGTIGVTSVATMMRALANIPSIPKITPGQSMAGIFIGVPFIIGTNFCVGNYLGKALRYAEDDQRGPVKIKLI
jgi:hypothetical protein